MSRHAIVSILVCFGLVSPSVSPVGPVASHAAEVYWDWEQWSWWPYPILDQEFVPISPATVGNACHVNAPFGQTFLVGFGGKLERLELSVQQRREEVFADWTEPVLRVNVYRTFYGYPAPDPIASVTLTRAEVAFDDVDPDVVKWTTVDLFWHNVHVQPGETLAVDITSLRGRCYRWFGNHNNFQSYSGGLNYWRYTGTVHFDPNVDYGVRTFIRP